MLGPNTVELLGVYGSDETHALSAWTSTSRVLDEEKRARIPALLAKLAKDRHETPFEKSALHFLVTSDIATHIHLLKHRIGVSVNAESARYRELREDRAYVPADWPEYLLDDLKSQVLRAQQKYHDYIEHLVKFEGFTRQRAKESARFVLPYATQITSDVQFNFRSFIHFQDLRNDEHAQLEVQEVARAMLELVRETHQFDASLEAFGYAK